MMEQLLQRSHELKQDLTDFVYDAEGDLAVALETFSADEMTRAQSPNQHPKTLVIDRFLVEGKIGEYSPIDLFVQSQGKLSESDRQLLLGWEKGFVGLFAITQVLDSRFELMNWLTAKRYTVWLNPSYPAQEVARLKEGEIVLVQIVPLSETDWMFFSPWTLMGKLGKPKLAVAIGNFKQDFKAHLYSDAPDLLEEAWRSVERYHQDFIEFFGSDEATMSGHQLSKKLGEFQKKITDKTLDESGIDRSKSLEELAQEAGISQEELEESAAEMGADAKLLSKVWKSQAQSKMAAPKIELPPNLKQADQITALSHPIWGQMFLVSYPKIVTLLTASAEEQPQNAETIVRRALQEPEMNAFAWHRLAEHYPAQLEALLRSTLNRPEFDLAQDLDALLQEHSKPLEPDLPETASVPVHLNELFQDAVMEVNKNKSKGKTKKKTAAGF